jgi:hypothetical protein
MRRKRIWSQSEWCEGTRAMGAAWSGVSLFICCLLPLAGCLATAPHHEGSLGRGRAVCSTKRIAASRLRATGQNRRTPAILLIDRWFRHASVSTVNIGCSPPSMHVSWCVFVMRTATVSTASLHYPLSIDSNKNPSTAVPVAGRSRGQQ